MPGLVVDDFPRPLLESSSDEATPPERPIVALDYLEEGVTSLNTRTYASYVAQQRIHVQIL